MQNAVTEHSAADERMIHSSSSPNLSDSGIFLIDKSQKDKALEHKTLGDKSRMTDVAEKGMTMLSAPAINISFIH